MNFKLRIMLRALRLRMAAGEPGEKVLSSYPRLSEEEKAELRREAGL